ncbi:HD domain-containing protein [Geomesophilobacter sediminis]|uniref:HD domain-containing protein n=1 Tax=Geomesophilobacter sediminis TaxID=2798584 RepID=A0A8J7M1F6_9BACT|nr:HD domain-containing protein [Geomesophilobacter sediminis]MBJ6726935.1 HD domain-containing protein [Geomesophilobacter sediminis]
MNLANDLAPFLEWFETYCRSYRSDNPDDQRNYDLKELHTRKVLEGILLIAAEGDERRRFLAGITALCHDLGRFPQYRSYGTFRDSDSVNHAHLSAQILSESDLLRSLPAGEAASIHTAVRLHNVFSIPQGLDPQSRDLLLLVRDADKLDIWRVFIEYYQAPPEERASAAALGLPEVPGCSPEVVATVHAGEIVRLTQLKTLDDFKMLQLSWLYDINFKATLALVRERKIIDQIAATLPDAPEVLGAVAHLQDFLEARLGKNEASR